MCSIKFLQTDSSRLVLPFFHRFDYEFQGQHWKALMHTIGFRTLTCSIKTLQTVPGCLVLAIFSSFWTPSLSISRSTWKGQAAENAKKYWPSWTACSAIRRWPWKTKQHIETELDRIRGMTDVCQTLRVQIAKSRFYCPAGRKVGTSYSKVQVDTHPHIKRKMPGSSGSWTTLRG